MRKKTLKMRLKLKVKIKNNNQLQKKKTLLNLPINMLLICSEQMEGIRSLLGLTDRPVGGKITLKRK